jgi:hypothetical protein
MQVKLFMENMWEFFLVFYFVPYKVNIPMYAGGFKQVLYNEYICWTQVKIHISDQTSLRICNSVYTESIPCEKSILSWNLILGRGVREQSRIQL